jgi:hypothetical protein
LLQGRDLNGEDTELGEEIVAFLLQGRDLNGEVTELGPEIVAFLPQGPDLTCEVTQFGPEVVPLHDPRLCHRLKQLSRFLVKIPFPTGVSAPAGGFGRRDREQFGNPRRGRTDTSCHLR